MNDIIETVLSHLGNVGEADAASIAKICGLKEQLVYKTLSDAVADGVLTRKRNASGGMVYSRDASRATAWMHPAVAALRRGPVAGTPRADRLDVPTISITYRPLATRSTSAAGKWDALLYALSRSEIKGGELPTQELDRQFSGAIKKAIATWSKRDKSGVKLRAVMHNGSLLVQRVE